MISPELIKKGLFWTKGVMLVTGCTKCSEGCAHCWSEVAHVKRQAWPPVRGIYNPDLTTDGRFNGKVQFNLRLLEAAAKAKKPQVIAIWNDLYHEGVTLEQVGEAHRIMANKFNSHHTFLIVTKRPHSAANYCEGVSALSGGIQVPDNIWHIVTAENQARADERIPHLLRIPGKRGLIIEPMLGEINLNMCGQGESGGCAYKDNIRCKQSLYGIIGYDVTCKYKFNGRNIHQVILGGETGTGARPMHPDWARSVRDQCAAAGVPFFFKSWGEWSTEEDEDVLYGEFHGAADWIECCLCVEGTQPMYKIGKKRTGRLLDGKEHNALAWNE